MKDTIERKDNIIFIPSDCEVSHVSIFFNAGSQYEKEGEHGMAHLTEHTIFFQGEAAYLQKLEAQGVLIDGQTTTTFLTFTSKQLAHKLSDALPTFIDMVFAPNYTKEDVEREKVILKNELLQTSPSDTFQQSLGVLFGVGHPYTYPSCGIPEEIECITYDAVDRFVKERLVPANALVVVVGNVDREKVVEICKVKGILSALVQPKAESQSEIQKEEVQCFVVNEGEVSEVTFMIPTGAITDFKERTILSLLRSALSDYHTSFLNRELRQKHQYIYDIESDSGYFSGGGYVELRFSTQNRYIQEVITLSQELLTNFSDHITQEDLERFKFLNTTGALVRQSDTEALAWWYAEDLLLSGNILGYPDEFLSYMQAITLEEVKSACQKYLQKSYNVTHLS